VNIFGIGPLELLVILVLAFLVLGPERMGNAARQAGKMVRSVTKMTEGLPRSLDDLAKLGDQPPEADSAKQRVQRRGVRKRDEAGVAQENDATTEEPASPEPWQPSLSSGITRKPDGPERPSA
jgi:Sec-independent protein translocase protein TatA